MLAIIIIIIKYKILLAAKMRIIINLDLAPPECSRKKKVTMILLKWDMGHWTIFFILLYLVS